MMLPWMSPHAVVLSAFEETFLPREGSAWYCVCDAAVSPHLAAALRGGEGGALCLFSPQATLRLAEVAPWVAPLPRHGDAQRILGHVWGSGAVWVLRSSLDLSELRAHLRALMRPKEEPLQLLRIYDPRILGALLKSSTSAELGQIFEGLNEIGLEGSEPLEWERHSFDGAALITHRSPARWLRPRDTPERLAFAE